MPRPKSDDPKLQVNLRLPESVLKRWEARGAKWRQQMEEVLEREVAPLDTSGVAVMDRADVRQAFLDRQQAKPDRPTRRK